MFKLYGIPNCDTVKKAKDFLIENSIEFEFIDFKKSPPTKSLIEKWQKYFPGLPVNNKGQTYRKHKEEFERLSQNEKVTFLISHPSMIKRPILDKELTTLAFGFAPDEYKQKLGIK